MASATRSSINAATDGDTEKLAKGWITMLPPADWKPVARFSLGGLSFLPNLVKGGRLIVPLDTGYDQELTLFSRSAQGEMQQRKLLPVAFVPMTRKTARDSEESP